MLAAAAQKHQVGVVQVLECLHVGVWVNRWRSVVWSPECVEEMQEGGLQVCSDHLHCHR